MADVKILGKSIVVETPDGAKVLLGIIEIDCPACGTGQWTIIGHHMRGILRILAEWVDKHPDLTGPEQITMVKQESWTGKTGGDPTNN